MMPRLQRMNAFIAAFDTAAVSRYGLTLSAPAQVSAQGLQASDQGVTFVACVAPTPGAARQVFTLDAVFYDVAWDAGTLIERVTQLLGYTPQEARTRLTVAGLLEPA